MTLFDAVIFLRRGRYMYSKGEVNIEDASVFGRLSHFCILCYSSPTTSFLFCLSLFKANKQTREQT